MRLSGPVYESLPYAYMGLGAGAMVFSYFRPSQGWSDAVVGCGMLAIVCGLVIVLRRRDYRAQKRRYGAALDAEE